MRLVFIDETTDRKSKAYRGFCIATIYGRLYPTVKREAEAILSEESDETRPSSSRAPTSFPPHRMHGC